MQTFKKIDIASPESLGNNKNDLAWVQEIVRPAMSKLKSQAVVKTDIAGLYVPIVQFLRAFGFCPLCIQRDPVSNTVSYCFKWNSLPAIYNFFLGLFCTLFSTSTVIMFIHVCFIKLDYYQVLEFQGITIIKDDVFQNRSAVMEFGTRLVPATFPLYSSWIFLSLVVSCSRFLRILNNWPEFQKAYTLAFSYRMDDPFKKLHIYRNMILIFFTLLAFLCVSMTAAVFLDCESWRGCIFPSKAISTIAASFSILLGFGYYVGQVMSFRVLRDSFEQIQVGIKLWSDKFCPMGSSPKYGMILSQNVKKWLHLITLVKKQVQLVSDTVAFYNVAMILMNFIYLCLGIFSWFHSKTAATEGNRSYILLTFCSTGFALLIASAFICEDITKQEKLVIVQLRMLLDASDFTPSMIKIQNLISSMTQDPAQIRFWNVFTLNKSFLLQLMGQVATYLIVLIQFDNVM